MARFHVCPLRSGHFVQLRMSIVVYHNIPILVYDGAE